MSRRRTPVFAVESLEARDVPANFGLPWAAGQQLTLSFVPDGTAADGATSTLTQTMQQQGWTTDGWQTEILRAVQTWTAVTNLNVAVVADSGAPLGSEGLAQGDARFGDLRIAARPLQADVLAITVPPAAMDSHAGDIILNSSVRFAKGGLGGTSGYDLFTVVLQEAGHAFGVDNSDKTDSAMFGRYVGPKTRLTSDDVSKIFSLYGGARWADAHEGSGNATFSRATAINRPSGATVNAALQVHGDVTATGDVDVYKFRTPGTLPQGKVTVRLATQSHSLLAGRLTVYNAAQQVVGTATAVGPAGGDLVVTVNAAAANADYFVKVDAAPASAHAVGGYSVTFLTDTVAPQTYSLTPAVTDDARSNDTHSRASLLSATFSGNAQYHAQAVLREAADVDVYRFPAPANSGDRVDVYVAVRPLAAAGLRPVIRLTNASGTTIAARVLATGGTVALVAENLPKDQEYYVHVSADPAGAKSGAYRLAADIRSLGGLTDSSTSGTVAASQPSQYHSLVVARTQLVKFALSARNAPATTTAVQMTVFNVQGQAVGSLFARSGDTASCTLLLAQGTYQVRVSGGTNDGSALRATDYTLAKTSLSDPIGTGEATSGGEVLVDVPIAPGDLGWIGTLLPHTNPWL